GTSKVYRVGLSGLLFIAFFFLQGLTLVYGQEVSGTVYDAQTDETMPGVNVYVTSSPSVGTSTDSDGAYSLSIPNEADSLTFTFVGYQSQRVAISGRNTIDI